MGVTCIKYNEAHRPIEQILDRVDRFGEYCTSHRAVVPMPRLEVEGVGMISFPVPRVHAEALIGKADPAPYGRGPETIVDRTVRDCWQIDADEVQVGGPGWSETFGSIVESVGRGLGCADLGLEARLYKLLVYETGGFFAEHRDSEKVAGMIGTLVVSLPAAGAGGELVVSHGGQTTDIDLSVENPSELAYAAFYADCSHQTRPLREGHRVSLVYNLVLTGSREERFARAPDHSGSIAMIAGRLADWARTDSATRKIVWILDHAYSLEGLSFDWMKGLDASVSEILAKAARAANCSLHAAILQIEESGIPLYDYYGYGDDSLEDIDMDEVTDWQCWLGGWVAQDGSSPEFGRIPLRDGEVLPANALDNAEPDHKVVHEASGNEGVSIEHTYRKAALVMWPSDTTVSVLAQGSLEAAIAFVENQTAASVSAPAAGGGPKALVPQLIDAWHDPPRNAWGHAVDEGSKVRSRFLRLLAGLGDDRGTIRFLEEIVIKRYTGGDNDALIETAVKFGPRIMEKFLCGLIESKMDRYVKSLAALTWGLAEALREKAGEVSDDAMRPAARGLLESLPRAFEELKDPRTWPRPSRESVDPASIAQILQLGWRFDLGRELEDAARVLVGNPKGATPDRDIPMALALLGSPGRHCTDPAFRMLWRHAAEFLLERSADRPADPTDWRIVTRIDCDCEACRALQDFCDNPVKRKEDFKMNKNYRDHLESQIRNLDLPMDRHTVTYGRPYTLVCTKNRADHQKRLEQYAQDVEHMRRLDASMGIGHTDEEVGILFRRVRTAHQRVT